MCCSRRLANGPAVQLAHLLTLAETNWRDNKPWTQEVRQYLQWGSKSQHKHGREGCAFVSLDGRADAAALVLFGATEQKVKKSYGEKKQHQHS